MPADDDPRLVWEAAEATAEVYTTDAALRHDAQRYGTEFVIDTQTEADEDANAFS